MIRRRGHDEVKPIWRGSALAANQLLGSGSGSGTLLYVNISAGYLQIIETRPMWMELVQIQDKDRGWAMDCETLELINNST